MIQRPGNRSDREQLSCRIIFLLALLVTGCGGCAFAQSAEDSNGDTQLWPDVQISFRVNQRLALNLYGTVREGHNLTGITSERVGAGASITLNKYLSVSPSYYFVANQPDELRHNTEHRFFLDLTLRLPLGRGFMLVDRNRAELRKIDGSFSRRYRNRLQIERAINLYDHKITPYLAGERFYDDRFHLWTRNLFTTGVRVPLHEHFTLDSYYMRYIDLRARPGHLHIIGMMMRLEF